MFRTLGRFVSRRPWYVIAAWLVLTGIVLATAPTLQTTTDESEFLPAHYESVQAGKLQSQDFPADSTPGAIIVFDRADGSPLTSADRSAVTRIADRLGPQLAARTFQPQVATTSADGKPNISADGMVQLGIIGLTHGSTGYTPDAIEDAEALRDDLAALASDTDLRARTTGPVPQALDSQESTDSALTVVGVATVGLIVLLLALIFRSVIICLMPILVVGLVSAVATGLIGFANELFDLKADSSIQVILIVVLYGIGTDYILFFLFRYRERLRHGSETRPAVGYGLARAGEAIASAGGVVIVAFLALLLSSLSVFRAIGPALAIAVAVTMLAVLTLVPAIVTVLGPALFWPSRNWRTEPTGARFARLGTALGRRPALFATGSGLVLAGLAVFAFGFNPSFDFNSSLPSGAESTEALQTFRQHFAAGAAEPVPVILKADEDGKIDPAALTAMNEALRGADGVAQVFPPRMSPDGTAAAFSVVLTADPVSTEAMDDVAGPIRTAAHAAAPAGTSAYVGGTPSVFVDMQRAMTRDYAVVFPLAGLVILVILALVLRALVAPLYLMAAVGLGFGATLGATVIVFQHVRDESGLIFTLPIYIYLFVTALGTDYNILMITRLREEARAGREPRPAAAEAVRHAGPTIAAAGVILAGTFASLMLGGNSLLVSMGFALSFGIVIAAFVMSMFFTPALTALLGHWAWWPGHGDTAQPNDPAEMSDGTEPSVSPAR